jgi:hypothetical protein
MMSRVILGSSHVRTPLAKIAKLDLADPQVSCKEPVNSRGEADGGTRLLGIIQDKKYLPTRPGYVIVESSGDWNCKDLEKSFFHPVRGYASPTGE